MWIIDECYKGLEGKRLKDDEVKVSNKSEYAGKNFKVWIWYLSCLTQIKTSLIVSKITLTHHGSLMMDKKGENWEKKGSGSKLKLGRDRYRSLKHTINWITGP